MASICALASEHGLALLEDGSNAHGARQGGRLVGTFGQGSAFSLQAQKLITGGEGGIVLTDNEEVFYRALMLGHFNKRCRQEIPQEHPLYQFAITGMGMKLRAHPLAAAIAVEQFSHLDVWIANKCKNVAILTETLAGIPGLELPRVANDSVPSWYAYNLRFTSEMTERHSVAFLHERLIAAGCTEIDRASSTRPLHLLPLFQNPAVLFPNYGANGVSYKPGDFPVSEALYETTLKLPVWCMDGD